jgi:hypothetical protein
LLASLILISQYHVGLNQTPNSVLLNSYSQVNPKITLSWDFTTEPATWILRCVTTGYCGVGFGTGMTGADILTLEVDDNNNLILTDRYATMRGRPRPDTEQGGVSNVKVLETSYDGTILWCKFTRPLDTGDSKDYVIKEGMTKMLWAWSSTNYMLANHKVDRGLVEVDLTQGAVGEAKEIVDLKDQIILAHELTMILGWTFAADIGLIFVRYMRAVKGYVIIHQVSYAFANTLTLVTGTLLFIGKANFERIEESLIFI